MYAEALFFCRRCKSFILRRNGSCVCRSRRSDSCYAMRCCRHLHWRFVSYFLLPCGAACIFCTVIKIRYFSWALRPYFKRVGKANSVRRRKSFRKRPLWVRERLAPTYRESRARWRGSAFRLLRERRTRTASTNF